ncbi:MAG: ECF transporter S component [Clostridia bacterium]|nr:ECF transporter S component [Clostridia bacterium]
MKTKKLVIAAMLAALVCVTTMAVKIPSPLKGYLNLGDCVVLLSGWILSPFYSFFAAGLGSALADIISGYAIYAPATFVIKGVMAIAAFFITKALCSKFGRLASAVLGGLVAELIMVFGYFIFEGFIYGFSPSLINIPANAVQGLVGLIIGVILIKIIERSKIFK